MTPKRALLLMVVLSVVTAASVFFAAGVRQQQGANRDGNGGPTRAEHNAGRPDDKAPRFATYLVEQADFNRPVSPFRLFVDVSVSGTPGTDIAVRIVVQRGEPVDLARSTHRAHRGSHILPYWYRWQLRDRDGNVTHEWLAHFLQNRDLTYHTIVRLPLEDLERSHVLLYFEDVDSDGTRDDLTLDVDLSGIAWDKIDGIRFWRDGMPVEY